MTNALKIADNLTAWTMSHGFKRVLVKNESVPPHTVDDLPNHCRWVFWVVVDSVVDDIVHDVLLRFFPFCLTMCLGDVDSPFRVWQPVSLITSG